jgi:hypothetical protein
MEGVDLDYKKVHSPKLYAPICTLTSPSDVAGVKQTIVVGFEVSHAFVLFTSLSSLAFPSGAVSLSRHNHNMSVASDDTDAVD